MFGMRLTLGIRANGIAAQFSPYEQPRLSRTFVRLEIQPAISRVVW